MKTKIRIAAIRIGAAVVVIMLIIWIVIAQPTFRKNQPSPVTVDPARLKSHVVALSETFYPRNYQSVSNLDRCAAYIAQNFTNAGAQVESQEFTLLKTNVYRNIIGRFGIGKGNTLVIGAHYDSCEVTHGADDNASSVAALMELAYLFGKYPPKREIELVAYTLEEPPFFRSAAMGSAVHAKRLAASGRPIAGVIVLEMIGYYRDDWGSQSYPLPLLYLLYPSRGNFIGVVSRWDQGDWIKKIKTGMKGATDLPVYSIRSPSFVPGIDFSDHLNYWPYGFRSVMITDTAFFRNKAYHGLGDTAERLDYDRLGKVVNAVYATIETL